MFTHNLNLKQYYYNCIMQSSSTIILKNKLINHFRSYDFKNGNDNLSNYVELIKNKYFDIENVFLQDQFTTLFNNIKDFPRYIEIHSKTDINSLINEKFHYLFNNINNDEIFKELLDFFEDGTIKQLQETVTKLQETVNRLENTVTQLQDILLEKSKPCCDIDY